MSEVGSESKQIQISSAGFPKNPSVIIIVSFLNWRLCGLVLNPQNPLPHPSPPSFQTENGKYLSDLETKGGTALGRFGL